MSAPRDETRSRSAPPPHHDADVVLPGGGATVRVRAVRPDDEPRLSVFLQSLSERSRRLRFVATVTNEFLNRAAARFSNVDAVSTFGLVATTGVTERIIGHAM